ncbi:MAG: phosphopentomutase [Candidatus Melainabacteria bacterium]|nr:phosphopentomutase [Candidatus Melainabacteria bacterium]
MVSQVSTNNPANAPRTRRVFLVVIDALGVGALPDAPAFGDSLSVNTLGNIDRHAQRLHLPHLAQLGLGHIVPLAQVPAVEHPTGVYGKLAEVSLGKDTTTGHWEMAGIILETPFPVFPEGFPTGLIEQFVAETGCGGVLGNKPASGTAILDELGVAHLETGFPIVYTSADSVFQVAAHVDRVPLETLYSWCEVARRLLEGPLQVSRVIARPFEGSPGGFRRLGAARHDYAVPPPTPNVLTTIAQQTQGVVLGVGKIDDIFCGVGITHHLHTRSNAHGLEVLIQLAKGELALPSLAKAGFEQRTGEKQLIFINLVETDMNFGHRRDVNGYAHALEAIDTELAALIDHLTPEDLLLITADHGCDPTAPGSDHTREYVPLLMFSKGLSVAHPAQNLGIRQSFADVGQTALAWLGIQPTASLPGKAVLPLV